MIDNSLRLPILAKVAAPERGAIQQPLDFGATGLVIPDVGGAEHAAAVTAFAKFPPLGSRSFAGGRTVRYGAPADDFFTGEDAQTVCLPMIETVDALDAVEAIAALPTVDGLFVGSSGLSLQRGRGRYRRTDEDRRDLERISAAAHAAGKSWVMPAWTAVEQQWARELGARLLIVAEDQGILVDGLAVAITAARCAGSGEG